MIMTIPAHDAAGTCEDRYRLLVESIVGYAIYMLDPQGVVVSWNRGAQRFKGYTDVEIIGQHFSRFYTDEDRATDLPTRALHIAATEGRFEQEGWRVRKDGSLMWAHVLIDPIRNEDGTLAGFAKVTRDLSDRKAAQDALQQSEQRFRLLVQGVQDYAIYMLDPTGRVSSWNRGAQRFKGYADDEIIGEHFSRFYTDEDRATDLPTRALHIATTEGRFEQEGWRVRKDGTRFWAHVVIDPIRGDHGELIGFAKITRDVTERRNAQQELEAAKEAAEAANRAKDGFLANISHEMRTPLNAMIGYSDLLFNNARATADIRRYAERIHSAGAILLSLIEDILELGKIEAGVIDVRDEPFALAALVSDAISIVRPSAKGKGLALRVRFEVHDVVLFLGDQDRLRQILLNLLNNAIKFTPSGSVELDVREYAGSEGRSRLRFSVTDTGIGIAKSEQLSVFERFHQVDPSMDRRFGGAGLGLAITKQLVERLGGRIGLESEIGQGSTFWFEVDLARSEAEARSDGVPADQALRSTARILVAEDVELNQDLVREYLEAAGHKVDIVANGEQAVEAARSVSYDLILMDLSMPVMDGLTAARVIRESGVAAARTAIVVCTANILPSHITAFREAGVDAYLRKPLRHAELYLTIERLLRQSGKQHDLPESEEHRDVGTADVDNLIALIGPKRVLAALEKLSLELQSLTVEGPAEPTEYMRLANQAHAVISTAGVLNMTSLAERCRDFENACRDAVGVDQAFNRLAPAIAQALTETQSFRAVLDGHTT